MKKIITCFSLLLTSATLSFSQVGAVAPDFTVKDLDGNSHNLYSILNSGKIVILDVSATWCGPCWNFHTKHYLKDLNDIYGEKGQNIARVIFYEGDKATTLLDLQGKTSGTMGDWITGTNYPIINESTISLNLKIYAPLGFPTINVICPATKKIVADLFDSQSLAAMKTVIETKCGSLTSVDDVNADNFYALYPNPATDFTSLKLNIKSGETVDVQIYSSLGQLMQSYNYRNNGINEYTIDLSNFDNGVYFIRVNKDGKNLKTTTILKQ